MKHACETVKSLVFSTCIYAKLSFLEFVIIFYICFWLIKTAITSLDSRMSFEICLLSIQPQLFWQLFFLRVIPGISECIFLELLPGTDAGSIMKSRPHIIIPGIKEYLNFFNSQFIKTNEYLHGNHLMIAKLHKK